MRPLTKLEAGGRRAGAAAAARSVDILRELARSLAEAADALQSAPAPDVESGIDFYEEVTRFEVELIARALRATGGQQRKAAQLLGLKVSTLNAKIKQYQILAQLPGGRFPR